METKDPTGFKQAHLSLVFQPEADPPRADKTSAFNHSATSPHHNFTLYTLTFQDVLRDWWFWPAEKKEVARGQVAWVGNNKVADGAGAKIRLYLTTWVNPKPRIKVATIDYLSTNSPSAPFWVAMTVEG